MEMLAKYLPDGSVVTRIALDEKAWSFPCRRRVHLVLSQHLESARRVKTVKLKGAGLIKTRLLGYYNFLVLRSVSCYRLFIN